MSRSTALAIRPLSGLPAHPAPAQEYVSNTPELGETCRNLMQLQVIRRHLIVAQSRADRGVEATLVQLLRGPAGLVGVSKDEYRAYYKAAGQIRKKIEKDGPDWRPPHDDELWRGTAAYIFQSRDARVIHDGFRQGIEASMERLARQLPVWDWVRGVKGVAELGLGVIIGEAGDLGGYATPAKLWKRLGLAVFDGRRQGNPGNVATTEDWILHGYNRKRRAQVWAFLSDVMFRAQWRGERDEDGKAPGKTGKPVAVPAHAIGPYGAVYAERKAWNLAREWTPAHADADARRVMSKRFLRDLWVAWNRRRETILPMSPETTLSPAAD
jgi:hypothetical protein